MFNQQCRLQQLTWRLVWTVPAFLLSVACYLIPDLVLYLLACGIFAHVCLVNNVYRILMYTVYNARRKPILSSTLLLFGPDAN
jgi:hypothetical protein